MANHDLRTAQTANQLSTNAQSRGLWIYRGLCYGIETYRNGKEKTVNDSKPTSHNKYLQDVQKGAINTGQFISSSGSNSTFWKNNIQDDLPWKHGT